MIELLKYITTNITGNENIQINREESEDAAFYTIHAPKEVMGLLIGKEGRTIRAIRTLAKARAIIDQEKILIRLEEQ